MSDHLFLIYFVAKFYAGTLLLLTTVLAIIAAFALRSFRLILWSAIALSLIVNLWIAAFVVLNI